MSRAFVRASSFLVPVLSIAATAAACGGDDSSGEQPGSGDASVSPDSSVTSHGDSGLDSSTTPGDASDSGVTDAGGPDADSGPPLSAAAACAALASETIPASAMSLATTGATITSAQLVAPADAGAASTGEYCAVLGSIHPVDSAAPPILFQVNLPTQWNGKAFQFGGGGYDGSVVTGVGAQLGAITGLTALGRGFLTFGSDSGHELKSPPDYTGESGAYDMSFALNAEALQNYASDQLKKTRDAAVYLIQQRYNSAPAKTYFAGGSGGGREAFATLQLWPQDYDGVIAYYPAWPLNEMLLNYGRIARGWAATGAYPDVAQQGVLATAAISACDALDGVTDGIVSDVKGCTFSPTSLLCTVGSAPDTCLTQVQITALQQGMGGTLTLPYSVPSGETQYPAYNIFAGSDLRNLQAGTVAPAYPPTAPMPFAADISFSYVDYAIVQNGTFNYLTLDPENPGSYQARIGAVSTLLDMNKTDLSAFQQRGGKLIMLHGLADATIPTASSEQYYERVVQTMGQTTVASFLKFYEVPGFAHGFGTFSPSWDWISAIDGWVENGTAPVNQVVTDTNAATAGRGRPLCEYPTWPKFGAGGPTGDPNSAASYTCATN